MTIDRLLALTRAVSTVGVWVAGALMTVSAVLIGLEVLLRKIGGLALSGASEIGGYMLAITSAWAFSFTLLNRSNIRFDAVYRQLPNGGRALLDIVGYVGLAVFVYMVMRHGVTVLVTTIELDAVSNSALATPLWIPQALWLAGLMFLCWTVTLVVIRIAVAALGADYDAVARLAGIEMAAEEVERETRGIAPASDGDDRGRREA